MQSDQLLKLNMKILGNMTKVNILDSIYLLTNAGLRDDCLQIDPHGDP